MIEFADIFAYGLTTTVFFSGSISMLAAFALSVAAMTRGVAAEPVLQVAHSA